jgi:hypothetical protein
MDTAGLKSQAGSHLETSLPAPSHLCEFMAQIETVGGLIAYIERHPSKQQA